MKNLFVIISIICIYFSSCTKNTPTLSANDEELPGTAAWLIPSSEVLDGGPGKDGIPSIDKPNFTKAAEVNFLKNSDLVIGIIEDGVAKAYPHPILDWHEIVNDDDVAGKKVAITYCPLTGTGIAWDRVIDGSTTTFGVSGKLYNTNLLPYDRKTDSYWSQMRLDCVNGDLINTKIATFHSIETTWVTWKKAYPNSMVLNTNTSFNRNYDSFPYGDYRTNHDNIIFPVSKKDNRLPAKERVLGLITNETKRAYSINLFEENKVINDNLNNEKIIVIGSKADNFIVAYKNNDGFNWQYVDDALPIIAQDDNGNKLDMSGKIVSGPDVNNKLEPIASQFMGYFFAFGTFYENIEIFED